MLQVKEYMFRKVLFERYINFMKWEDIAKLIDKPTSTTKGRIHARALQEITKYIEFFLKKT